MTVFINKNSFRGLSSPALLITLVTMLLMQFVTATHVIAASSSEKEITLRDDLGREIQLAGPAKRIVALSPHIVENVYAAGAGKTLVGVVSHSDYPKAARRLRRVGNFNAFSKEAILALEPDLVIVWASGSGQRKIAELEALGLTVFAVEPRALEDVARSLRNYGQLTGFTSTAAAASEAYLAQLQSLREKYAQKQVVSVFYQIWNNPLQTLNGEHIISAVIRLCGGRNVFADAKTLAPKVNIESVLLQDPQAIVASGVSSKKSASRKALQQQWLEEWRRWPGMQAIDNGNLFFVPPDYLQRHTPRLLLGAEQLCKQLDTVRAADQADQAD